MGLVVSCIRNNIQIAKGQPGFVKLNFREVLSHHKPRAKAASEGKVTKHFGFCRTTR